MGTMIYTKRIIIYILSKLEFSSYSEVINGYIIQVNEKLRWLAWVI